MRFLVVLAIAACGGSPAAPTSAARPASAGSSADHTGATPPAPARPVSYPAPPAGPSPTGTWRVTLEFPRLHGRPAAIAADASGVYLAGAVLSEDDVRMRRWAVVKLDPTGAIAWSVVEELPRSPAPERIVLAGDSLIIAGQDGTSEPTRMLLVERRAVASGKRTWQRRFTARDPKCTTAACASKDAFGGVAVRGASVLYSATVDRPLEAAFGELSLAKGVPVKAYTEHSDLRAVDVAGDDAGLYLLEENLSKEVSVLKIADGKTAWKHELEGGATRFAVDAAGVYVWGKTVEKRALETGSVAWSSNLVGDHVDVAIDASGGIFATAMIDATPAPYFAVAQLDAASGAVQWSRRVSGYEEKRPLVRVAADKDALYLFGFEGEKWFVERRRKSDGALGEVPTTARVIEQKKRR